VTGGTTRTIPPSSGRRSRPQRPNCSPVWPSPAGGGNGRCSESGHGNAAAGRDDDGHGAPGSRPTGRSEWQSRTARRGMGREPQRSDNRPLPRHADRHGAGVNLNAQETDPGQGSRGAPFGMDTQRSAPRHPTAWRCWLAQVRRSETQGTRYLAFRTGRNNASKK
jgi:hypothetical protein